MNINALVMYVGEQTSDVKRKLSSGNGQLLHHSIKSRQKILYITYLYISTPIHKLICSAVKC